LLSTLEVVGNKQWWVKGVVLLFLPAPSILSRMVNETRYINDKSEIRDTFGQDMSGWSCHIKIPHGIDKGSERK
jgi:hypothetical protein